MGKTVANKVDIFTQAARAEFIRGYDATPAVPPIDVAISQFPSTGRVETYAWMDPAPGIAAWQGFRRFGKIGQIDYQVPNIVYDGAFEILNDDIDDDQTGGYMLKSAELGKNARTWYAIASLQNLALGQTTACFDGSNFFNSTHNIGSYPTGGNVFTATTAGNDGKTHAMVGLVTAGMLKPLLWQNREAANFRTDAGDNVSSMNRVTRAWAELRGAPAFGYWWDAILCKFANTPTLAEVLTGLQTLNTTFRQFILPKNQASDPNQYPHGQIKFTDQTLTIACSSGLDQLLRQSLTLSLIAQTENIYKGFANQVTAGYLDLVV